MPPALIPSTQTITGRLKAVLSVETDPALVRARQASERLVGSVRLGIILLFVASNLIFGFESGRVPLGTLLMSAGAVAYGLILLAAPKRFTGTWLPWAISSVDVTFASGSLLALVLMGF